MMLGNLRIDHFGAERLEPAEGALLVRLDQPRVTRNIGGQDRRQLALDPLALHNASPRLGFVRLVLTSDRPCLNLLLRKPFINRLGHAAARRSA
jgi:hypothetical protein